MNEEMVMYTPNLGILLLKQNQMQKEIAINEAIVTFDALCNNAVIEFNITSPPDEAEDGDLFVIAQNPEYVQWKQYAGYIAYYASGWRYIKPKAGLQLWIINESCLKLFNGEQWCVIFKRK